MSNDIYSEALEYHRTGRKGKIEVVVTKPFSTQKDLSLAYSPGVAQPCQEIAENKEDAYEYTAKGNLVAVISNGTAVLGLGAQPTFERWRNAGRRWRRRFTERRRPPFS